MKDQNFQISSLKIMSKRNCDNSQESSLKRDEHNEYKYIKNPYINVKEDILFHLTFSNKTDDLKAMFHDVKFVCMGGTVNRMKGFAEYFRQELNLPDDGELQDLTGKGGRYSMFKVGCILCVNHGMGFPSAMILLHELIKLMEYAGAQDPVFIRLGTSGGFDVPRGTVCIATQVLNEFLEPFFEIPILGKIYKWPCVLDQRMARDLKSIADEKHDLPVLLGRSISVQHFYEATAMKSGAICEHSDEDRKEYFDRLKRCNVICVDMESLALGAITHKVGIKAAFLAVVVDDDKGKGTEEEVAEWQKRPGIIVAEYIKRHLN